MKKWNVFLLSAAAAAFLGAAPFIAEETEVLTEKEAVVPETEKADDFSLSWDDGTTLEVINNSGITITGISAAETVSGESEEESSDKTAVVTLTDADGTEHIFEDIRPADMTDLSLTSEDSFLFIKYVNAEGAKKTAYETADEVSFDEAVSKYITDTVYIRAEPNKDSQSIGTAALGDEITATGALPKWIKVDLDGQTGYIARAYVSADKDAAEAAVSAENAARAAQQAAAAAAAAAAARASSGSGSGGGRVEVSREAFPDCDGSGHGYYLITYSDGTTATVNY